MAKEISEETKRLLKEVCQHFDQEDRFVRERQIRQWKKLKYYWNGFQRLWWSEIAHDWRVYDQSIPEEQSTDNSYYDKPINVFKAYLESIIAALSVTIPGVHCYPDDADNDLDLATAKAGDKIYDLISRHNDISLLWIHALYIYCTEGLIACYSYPKEHESYGMYNEPDYETTQEDATSQICPNCGAQLTPPDLELNDQEKDEFMPGEDDVISHNELNQGKILCSACMQEVDPELKTEKIPVTRLVGYTSKPKSRICMEVYGGLFVKVPNYAMKQEDCPYLIFSYETNYVSAVERYPSLRDKKTGNIKVQTGGAGNDPYEKWGRISTQYFGEYPLDTVTVNNCWLRPCAFNHLHDVEDVNRLKKLYPDGVKVVCINDEFVDAENESLDDYWTLTKNPLSDYLHHDPLGMVLTSVQDITNDIISLVIQTIEHGIPQTFADPEVLNFDQYKQTEVTPGAIYPARPKTGKSIGDAFYEIKTATLSGEILPFSDKIQEAGQLVSGALPSLFGGAADNGSKTAAQYAMSRAQALQRLQTPWKMLTVWWKTIQGKVIPMYIKEVKDDERIVEKDQSGNFINVFIRKSDLEGKIGNIELETSDQLPVTWQQQKDTIMQLLQSGNPLVMQALADPENLELLKQAIGLDDFNIPGEDDRAKQYSEIRELLESAPMPSIDPMTGMPNEVPSVDIEPQIDNNPIHAGICKEWAVSEAGRLAKKENPNGYKNVLLHMERHVKVMQAMSAQAPVQNAPNTAGAQNKPLAVQNKGQGNEQQSIQ